MVQLRLEKAQTEGHAENILQKEETLSSNVSFVADMQSCAVESKRGANVRSFIAI